MCKTLLCALICMAPAKNPTAKPERKEKLGRPHTTAPLAKPAVITQQPVATRYEYTPASPDYQSKWNEGQKTPAEGRHW